MYIHININYYLLIEDLELDHSVGIAEVSTDSENNVTEERTVKYVQIPKKNTTLVDQ